MNDFDYLSLDGKSLQLFLTVIEEESITGAARRLRITQSAVSHTIEKLRNVIGDPLFVRAGRGIVPTSQAKLMVDKVRSTLDDMKALTNSTEFNPADAHMEFTLAANDFQRDLILPRFFREIHAEAPGITFKIIPSDIHSPDVLRDDGCQLMLTPHPPLGADIIQKPMLTDYYVCYYDPQTRAAPKNLDEYMSAQHITISFGSSRSPEIEKHIREMDLHRDIFLKVPAFSGIPGFMKGTNLIASLPSLLNRNAMKDFAYCDLPFESPKLIMYLVWHRRYHLDAAHIWLRDKLEAISQEHSAQQ